MTGIEKKISNTLGPVTSSPVSINEIAGSLTSQQKISILARMGHEGLQDLNDLPADALYMIQKIEELNAEDSVEILKEAITYHEDDSNYPKQDYQNIIRLVENVPLKTEVIRFNDGKNEATDSEGSFELDWELEVRIEAALIHFHSPYPEVRAVTDPFDDPFVPVETVRSYILALIWTAAGSFVNEFFVHRQPPVSLTTSVIQLLLYPSGKLLERTLPDWGVTIAGTRHSLNPGPWNMKEQMFATILYSVSSVPAYVDSNIIVQKLSMFYDNQWVTFGYQFLLIVSTQCVGFGFAGLLRKFAIFPVRAVWPTILPTLALNRALMQVEKKEIINGWKISRYNFFFIFFIASFVYFWLPDYLFQAMSYTNWLTWIKPDNFNLAVVSGSILGMGLNPIPTFDWNIISFNNALTIPFFSQANQWVGTFLGTFIVLALYYSNYKWTGYMPINDNNIFTNTGEYYEVTEILTDNLFDKEKYDAYSPPFYSAGNLVVYGAFFAIYPFSFFYTIYNEWTSFKHAFGETYQSLKNFGRSNFANARDPHSKMMAKYKEVPDWWFYIVLVVATVLLIIMVEVFKGTKTPVWAIVFCLVINFIFLVPFTSILAITGFPLGLNVLVELVIGYALPGNGVALMTLKALGYNIGGQASTYVHDQKLAHYAKIAPRSIFRGQIISTILQCFITLGVLNFEMSSIKDFCSPHQKQQFSCPGEVVYYSASVFWGVIGPKKVFSGIYPIFQYCFLIGFLLIFPCIAFKRYAPKKYSQYFEPTLIIGGMLNFAPYNISYLTSGFYASYIFMNYIKRRYLGWWEKYTYVLTAALSAGLAFSAIIIFFAVEYHEKDVIWWGNNVSFVGIDGGNGRQSNLDPATAPGGYFGPRQGHYP